MEEFEVTLSMGYMAETPEDAAAQFIANINVADWYLEVKNTRTGEVVGVDTETFEVE